MTSQGIPMSLPEFYALPPGQRSALEIMWVHDRVWFRPAKELWTAHPSDNCGSTSRAIRALQRTGRVEVAQADDGAWTAWARVGAPRGLKL